MIALLLKLQFWFIEAWLFPAEKLADEWERTTKQDGCTLIERLGSNNIDYYCDVAADSIYL